MTFLIGYLAGGLTTVLGGALYYARWEFEVVRLKFEGRRWLQPAGWTASGARPRWRHGIAIRLRRGQHILLVRRQR